MKVYLAKSNLACPDHVAMVRAYLNSVSGVEVVEFKGGNYSNKPLLQCEKLIIVPGKDNCVGFGEYVIGKGLYNQREDFAETTHYKSIFVSLKPLDNILNLSYIKNIDIIDHNYVDYAIIQLNQCFEIITIFNSPYPTKQEVKSIENEQNLYYLLIK